MKKISSLIFTLSTCLFILGSLTAQNSAKVILSKLHNLDSLKKINVDYVKLANELNELALLYQNIGDYSNSIKTHKRILEIKELPDTSIIIPATNYNIGVSFHRAGYEEEAKIYCNAALIGYQNLKQLDPKSIKIKIGYCYDFLCAIYANLNRNNESSIYCNKADSLFRNLKEFNLLANTLVNKGYNAIRQEQNHLAISFFADASKLFRLTNDSAGIATVMVNLCAATYNIIEFDQNNKNGLKKCLRYLDTAKLYTTSASDIELKINTFLYTSEIYVSLSQYDSAYHYYREHIILKDSVFNLKKFNELENIKTKLEIDNNILKNKALEEENLKLSALNKNKTFLIAIIAFGLVTLTLVLTLVLYKRKINFERKERAYNAKMLIKQMDPHFVFNAINSAQEFVLLNESEKAQDFLSKISKLIRFFLNYHSKSEILLNEEIEILNLYTEIESQRLNKKISFNIQNNSNLDLDEILIPPALIQPLIENSIWHGFRNSDNNLIDLIIDVKDRFLCLKVKDNGSGLTSGNLKNSSLGISLIRDRLKLLDENSELLIENNAFSNGVTATLNIPLRLRF